MLDLALASAAWLAQTALAADPPPVPCPSNLPSCGGANNVLAENLAPTIARILVYSAVGLALIYILYAGLQMMMNNGDEGKATKARMGIVYAAGGLMLALMSQNIYSFVATADFGNANDALFEVMRNVAGLIVIVFNPLFVIMVILAGVRMVLDRGKEEEFNKARTSLLWACIGAIVINVAFAIVKGILGIAGVATGL